MAGCLELLFWLFVMILCFSIMGWDVVFGIVSIIVFFWCVGGWFLRIEQKRRLEKVVTIFLIISFCGTALFLLNIWNGLEPYLDYLEFELSLIWNLIKTKFYSLFCSPDDNYEDTIDYYWESIKDPTSSLAWTFNHHGEYYGDLETGCYALAVVLTIIFVFWGILYFIDLRRFKKRKKSLIDACLEALGNSLAI